MSENPTVRKILIVGKTGGGKSAIGNVILKNKSFEEVDFIESGTATVQSGRFHDEENNLMLEVFDTIGVCDTRFKEVDNLSRIADAAYEIREGVHCILYVISGRITREEIRAFNILHQILFTSEVQTFMVLVRSHFSNFQKTEAIQRVKSRDLESLNEKLGSNFTQNQLLYVDNPPDDEEKRSDSRTLLLTKILSMRDLYQIQNREVVLGKIQEHVEMKKRKENEMKEAKEKLDEQKKLISDLIAQNKQHTERYMKAQEDMKEMNKQHSSIMAGLRSDLSNLNAALHSAMSDRGGGGCIIL